MNAQQLATGEHPDLRGLIEPIFIEHFKMIHGESPTLAELKQHLANTKINDLVDYMCNANRVLSIIYSKSELAQIAQFYIRKLH